MDARLAEGADYIKIMYDDGHAFGRDIPNLTDEMLVSAVQAARARGTLAVAHVTSRHGASAAVAAGADGLAHVFADEPPDEALSREAADQHTFLIATPHDLAGDLREPERG